MRVLFTLHQQATVALMNGLVFSSYGFLMKLQLERAGTLPTLTQVALAGAGAGIVTSYGFTLILADIAGG
jgi:hypothetical protein